MNDYTFSTLNDEDLETLARDLLNAKLGLNLHSFRSGQDKGIDLRQSTAENVNSIVVQVKHYLRSGVPQLKSDLKKKELRKVKALNPARYVVVTSLPLSAQDAEEIQKLMSPFIRTVDDVIGKEELNRYISEFPAIEQRHFKLWFSSVSLLNNVLNNAITGRTVYRVRKIVKDFPKYVVTQRLDAANKILEREKVLLITGQPGIGKTTLAEILIFERMKSGFEFYEVTSVREAEDMVSVDGETKQLFYMDDFLGDIHLELVAGVSSTVAAFIDRIRNTPNKYLLLTSRTVILQAAIEKFEKLKRSRLAEERFELKLTDYSPLEKGRILYNHIFFSEIDDEQCRAILADRFYQQIIKHQNFAPRLIEFVTEPKRIKGKSTAEFKQFVTDNLANPSEIWRDSFYTQIAYFDRCLLYTLFTFHEVAEENDLRRSFVARLRYEKEKNYQTLSSNDFRDSIRNLLNGFITSYRDDEKQYFQLINPSLADFIYAELEGSVEELVAVVSALISHIQLSFFEFEGHQPIEVQQVFVRKILSGEIDLQQMASALTNYQISLKIEWLAKLCPAIELDGIIADLLEGLDFDASFRSFGSVFEFVSKHKRHHPRSFEFLKKHFLQMVGGVIDNIDNGVEGEGVPELFETFEQDFEAYSISDTGSDRLFDLLCRASDDAFEQNVSNRERDFFDIYDVEEHYDETIRDNEDLKNKLFTQVFPFIAPDFQPSFDRRHWERVVDTNRDRIRVENFENQVAPQAEKTPNPEADIDDLFARLNERISSE